MRVLQIAMTSPAGGAFALLLIWLVLSAVGQAFAHESWISRGGLKNGAGEWCCGEGDCGELSPGAVRSTAHGYEVHGTVTIRGSNGKGDLVERVDELVPQSEAQPSPDGLYWRCKRPDGTRRCFFAPPPSG